MFQAPGRDRAGWAVQGCACMTGCLLVVMASFVVVWCPRLGDQSPQDTTLREGSGEKLGAAHPAVTTLCRVNDLESEQTNFITHSKMPLEHRRLDVTVGRNMSKVGSQARGKRQGTDQRVW